LYSNTKTDATGLQIPKEYLHSCCIGFCIMRRLVLNTTILTAVTSKPLKVWISQQAVVQRFEDKTQESNPPFEGKRVV
jgi:hypothetical protein